MTEQKKETKTITVPGTKPVHPPTGTPAAVPDQPASIDSIDNSDDSGHGDAPPRK